MKRGIIVVVALAAIVLLLTLGLLLTARQMKPASFEQLVK